MSNENGTGRGAPGETANLQQALWEIGLREYVRESLGQFLVDVRAMAEEAGIEFEATLDLDLRIDASGAVRRARSDAEVAAGEFPTDRIGGPNDRE
jgi:hypothetical protein